MTARADLVALAEQWMALWSGGGLAGFDDLHDPLFVDHAPAGREAGRAGLKAGIEALYAAFPDFRAETERMAVDEAARLVAIAWRGRGAHQGEFLGRPATGAVVEFRGLELIRIAGGRIAERWGEWDGLAILEQLDAARR